MQTHAKNINNKNINNKNNRAILQDIAYKAMLDRNLLPEFSHEALAELERLQGASPVTESVQDMRSLLWSSIDNADSRDLDQLTVAESMAGDRVKLLVAIADVDAFVKE